MTVQELIDKLIEQCGNRSPSTVQVVTYRMKEDNDGVETWAYWEEEPPKVDSYEIHPFPFTVTVT